MSLFSSIGKGLKSVAKAVTNTVKGAAKIVGTIATTAAPLVALVPGIGPVASTALGIAGGLLAPPKTPAIATAPLAVAAVQSPAGGLPLSLPLLAAAAWFFFLRHK